jgi:hypothetical protein
LRNWGDVIAADPSVAHRIARSPALLRNQSFLEQHPRCAISSPPTLISPINLRAIRGILLSRIELPPP